MVARAMEMQRRGGVKRQTMKARAAPGWKKLSGEEIRLAKKWYADESLSPNTIAERLDRDKSTLTRLLVKQAPRERQGRPLALTTPQVDLLEKRLHDLIVKADGRYEVTASMLKKNTRAKACERVILNALHKRNIYFRAMRGKPLLTDEDVKARFAFAKKHRHRSAAWWRERLHAFIDGKHFKAYITAAGRRIAAMHPTRGAYRCPGKGLHGAHVKPPKGLNFNPGAKSLLIVAAVGKGKLFMWHAVRKSMWNGAAAAKMYPPRISDGAPSFPFLGWWRRPGKSVFHLSAR